MSSSGKWYALQRSYFARADPEHYHWQTGSGYFALRERELLSWIDPAFNERFLEVGCAEGGNLCHVFGQLGGRPGYVIGLDLSCEKLHFAKERFPGMGFVCGDAGSLPFRSETFDVILLRDVLHHLCVMKDAVREIHRVCRRGGRVIFIEANGTNPVMLLWCVVRRAERGMFLNTPGNLEGLVGAYFRVVKKGQQQPFPLFRLVLHYRFGLAGLGHFKAVAKVMDWIEHLLAPVIPPNRWGYVMIMGVKEGAGEWQDVNPSGFRSS